MFEYWNNGMLGGGFGMMPEANISAEKPWTLSLAP
jgi:hypothetical protein